MRKKRRRRNKRKRRRTYSRSKLAPLGLDVPIPGKRKQRNKKATRVHSKTFISEKQASFLLAGLCLSGLLIQLRLPHTCPKYTPRIKRRCGFPVMEASRMWQSTRVREGTPSGEKELKGVLLAIGTCNKQVLHRSAFLLGGEWWLEVLWGGESCCQV